MGPMRITTILCELVTVVSFLCIASFVLTEIIQFLPGLFSQWCRTFLVCALILWLILDNLTLAIDLRRAVDAQRQLSDKVVILEQKVLFLEGVRVKEESDHSTATADHCCDRDKNTDVVFNNEHFEQKQSLTLEMLHWNLLSAKACAMYYIRRIGSFSRLGSQRGSKNHSRSTSTSPVSNRHCSSYYARRPSMRSLSR